MAASTFQKAFIDIFVTSNLSLARAEVEEDTELISKTQAQKFRVF